MGSSDQDAQRKRTARLREEIGRMIGSISPDTTGDGSKVRAKPSPRSLIERRMNEFGSKVHACDDPKTEVFAKTDTLH